MRGIIDVFGRGESDKSIKIVKSGMKVLEAECEIYNWKELNKKYGLRAKNDAEVLFNLLGKKGFKEVLKELDGVFAFAYWINDKIYLCRDIIGVKPLWYSHSDGFAFASEKKALEKIGYMNIEELNPRKILVYDIRNDRLSIMQRDFFSIMPEIKKSEDKIRKHVKKLLADAVKKRIPEKKFGILFSGGIDSTVIAQICKGLGHDFTCYISAFEHPGMKAPSDLVYAKKIAEEMGLKLKVKIIKLNEVEGYLKKIVPLIEDSNVVKATVALTFFAACELARKDGVKVIFSGVGSEEIFAGYHRHRESSSINKECISGLLKMYEMDTYRDDVITMHHNIELRVPFLDKKLAEYALRIPAGYKLKQGYDKAVLRDASADLGVPSIIVKRKKKAAQYGSNFDKAIEKLTRKAGLRYKSEYLRRFYPGHNLKLGVLFSSGKDSNYALHVIKRRNYGVSCLITIRSENPDSFMFHTPNIGLAELQAKSLGIPIIQHTTKGEKEKELLDLEKAIGKAKDKYQIEGIVTGALFSNYQRERIERVCDKLGLKIFSPLWDMNQETEMRQLIEQGFVFVLSSIAAQGLDKSWLGRQITDKDVDRLVELNKKVGLNVAGEGGEFESLVLDSPDYKKRIKIKRYKIIEENKNTARMIVEEAGLVGKK